MANIQTDRQTNRRTNRHTDRNGGPVLFQTLGVMNTTRQKNIKLTIRGTNVELLTRRSLVRLHNGSQLFIPERNLRKYCILSLCFLDAWWRILII